MLSQMATTNIVEMMCQNIQWVVSKYAVPAIGIRMRILRMFRIKSVRRAVMSALMRVSGFMPAVDRIRIRRR